MGSEAGDVIVEIDPIPVDDVVITIDPIEFVPVEEPVAVDWTADGASDVPPDAQTFGGPVDVILDPAPVDDVPPDAQTFGGPVDVILDPVPVDDVPVDDGPADVPADGGSDDGLIFTTTVIDDAPVDAIPVDSGEQTTAEDTGSEGGSDVVIDRPVDPEPNWRTLDGVGPGEGEGGGGEVIGSEGGSTDDVPIFDKDIIDDTGVTDDTGSDDSGTSDDGTTDDTGSDPQVDVIYTLDPSDPLIYATTSLDDTPGRPTDPLPFERGNPAPATDPAAPETASDVVHYAASEPFHTGLDLL